MMRHPLAHGVDVRRWFPGLSGATSRQTLGFDESSDDLLTSVDLLDEAIEQLYGGRRRVCRGPGKGTIPPDRSRGRFPGR
jgi:hypothetical protein